MLPPTGERPKEKETDIALNNMFYTYDNYGRLTSIKTTHEENHENISALSYSYVTPKQDGEVIQKWYAVTNNKVSFDPTDTTYMKTIVSVDALGRADRTGKSGEKYEDGNSLIGWNVSGDVTYDPKGRVVEEYMTYFVEGSLESDFLDAAIQKSEQLVTITEYDSVDRQTLTTLPDKAVQENIYSINSENQFVTKSIDPLNNESIQVSNGRGNILSVIKRDNDGNELTKTRYEYNAIGEMLKAYPVDESFPVTLKYDILGRRVSIETKDSGLKEYFYNDKGQLWYEKDSNLSLKAQTITYIYDAFGRVLKIDYPESVDVMYEYHKAGVNGAGQVKRVVDETGSIEYVYGELGEVKTETRIIKHLSSEGILETDATMSYESDYLGRMSEITYPDGEVVRYGYDDGGQVNSVIGVYKGLETKYVEDIGYDEYGQRVFIRYGNGIETKYTYDEERRWLENIVTTNERGQLYQNISYSFDMVGNVSKYTNSSFGYETSQYYDYDGLYQLIDARGTSINKQYGFEEYVATYKQKYDFDIMGNMLKKTSSSGVQPVQSVGDDLNYELEYIYDEEYAHRVKQIGDI